MKYHWQHITSGLTGTRDFSDVLLQPVGLTTEDLKRPNLSAVRFKLYELMNKWNSQGSQWKYWID